MTWTKAIWAQAAKYRKNSSWPYVYGLASVWNDAVQVTSQSHEYQSYLKWVPTTTPIATVPQDHPDYPGFLKPARRLQEQTLHTWDESQEDSTVLNDSDDSYAEDSLEIREEVTPNTALILLLQGITDLVDGASAEWYLGRVYFHARFKNGKYTSWSDGVLRSTLDRKILAIVKAKKRPRTVRGDEIVMQECAEMVGWLLANIDSPPMLNGQ